MKLCSDGVALIAVKNISAKIDGGEIYTGENVVTDVLWSIPSRTNIRKI